LGGRVGLKSDIDELGQAQLGRERFKGSWETRQLLGGEWP
jgi:hypothetical protein